MFESNDSKNWGSINRWLIPVRLDLILSFLSSPSSRRRLLDAPVKPSSRRRPLDARRRGSGAPPSPAPRALLLLLRLAPLLAPPAPRALLLLLRLAPLLAPPAPRALLLFKQVLRSELQCLQHQRYVK
ncbi:uncharacterized protein [Triticum aestivum]|uniref:uncharacterized protein n=1 Tax=Triticum aestivum TaxID=4565 RepID=UPI001D021A73|nr:uncharacterized protein LOC123087588 [Triticum aestivum]